MHTRKKWTPEDGCLVFDFEIVLDDQRNISEVSVEIHWWNIPQDSYRRTLLSKSIPAETTGKVSLDHRFPNGVLVEGYLRCVAISSEESDTGVWGQFHYGENKAHHFEGVMIELEPYRPAPPRPIPIPDSPAGPEEVIVDSGEHGDLFPYIYMRRWPKISDEDLRDSFIEYRRPALSPPVSSPPDSSPPAVSIYDQLCKMRHPVLPDTRAQMEGLAVHYIDGEQFVSHIGDLTGAIRYFPAIDSYIRGMASIDPTELVAEIERIVSKEKGEIQAYLHSQDYLTEKDRVWQSYFALIVALGYRYDLLEALTRTLAMAHLAEVVMADEETAATPDGIRKLANATVILPVEIFPLPPAGPSPPVSPPASPPGIPATTGWIEPYAGVMKKGGFEEVFSHWPSCVFVPSLGPQPGSFCIACPIRPCYLRASTSSLGGCP